MKYKNSRPKVDQPLTEKMKYQTFGFTLIELLVVIAIISLISSVGFVNFMDIRAKGRDQQRKTDLAAIASSLQQFRSQYGYYPYYFSSDAPAVVTGGVGGGGWRSPSDLVAGKIISGDTIVSPNLDPSYMKKILIDPTNGENCAAGGTTPSYLYYHDRSGYKYILFARLENDNDPAAQQIKTKPPTHWADTAGVSGCQNSCRQFIISGGTCNGAVYNYWIISP